MTDYIDHSCQDKVKYVYLKQVPIGTTFRYKKMYFYRDCVSGAFCQDELEYLEIDNVNSYDAVAINSEVKEKPLN